jgi:hypothetical protein
MLIQPENPVVVKSDPFEHAVAVEQTMIEYGDLCLRLLVKVSVNVNFEVHN